MARGGMVAALTIGAAVLSTSACGSFLSKQGDPPSVVIVTVTAPPPSTMPTPPPTPSPGPSPLETVTPEPSDEVDLVAISGVLDLLDSETADAGCEGQGGYSDIDAGTQVVVRDGSGEILGSTNLGPGEVEDGVACIYEFLVIGVPDDRKQYVLEIGRRGQVVSSRAEMLADEWSFEVGLGY